MADLELTEAILTCGSNLVGGGNSESDLLSTVNGKLQLAL